VIQRERLLIAFREAGQRGLTVIDAQQLHPPIQSLTGRMADLRALGHEFAKCGRRNRCQAWRLVGTRSGANGANPTTSPQDADRAVREACERHHEAIPGLQANPYTAEVHG
jgi:hypothetical protein